MPSLPHPNQPFYLISFFILIIGLITSSIIAQVVLAQTETVEVTILQVDDQTFPQVTIFLTVEQDGFPQTNLTIENFQLYERGRVKRPIRSLKAETEQALAVVLVLDISLDEARLAEVKRAALAFINQLAPQDQVRLLMVHNEIETLPFTNNKQVLRDDIDGLLALGNARTAFYQAVINATTSLTEADIVNQRPVVIMLTNIGDNVNQPSLDETLVELERLPIQPVYILDSANEHDPINLI